MGQQACGKERSPICLLFPDVRHETSGRMEEGEPQAAVRAMLCAGVPIMEQPLGLYSPCTLCRENIPLDHSMPGCTFSSFFQIS